MGQMRGAAPEWWGAVVTGYLKFLARRNRRPNTLRAYRVELDDFGSWLALVGVVDISRIQRSHIEEWQDELAERKAAKTQQVASSALRGALRWAIDHEFPVSSPTLWLRVETPRVMPGMPRPIPWPDLAVLQEALRGSEPADLWRLRTRALFWVLFTSGARISEGLSLPRRALRDGTQAVIQKGGRAHLLVVSEQARQAVLDYEAGRRDRCRALFASLEPSRQNEPMDWDEVQEGWNRLCHSLGVKRYTSHQLRHSCASGMRRNKIDIGLIAQHLGQRGLQHILNYALLEVDDRRRAVASLDALAVPTAQQRAVAIIEGAIAS